MICSWHLFLVSGIASSHIANRELEPMAMALLEKFCLRTKWTKFSQYAHNVAAKDFLNNLAGHHTRGMLDFMENVIKLLATKSSFGANDFPSMADIVFNDFTSDLIRYSSIGWQCSCAR